jgi:hypothetical protein
MIYKCVPIVTRHHRIVLRRYNEGHLITIVSKHVLGIHILATCHQTYSEATSMRACLQGPSKELLRLIVHGRMMSGAILRAVLSCASQIDDCCPGSNDLDLVMHEMRRSTVRELKGSTYMLRSLLMSNSVQEDTSPELIHSDITTHAALHTLLRRRPAPGTRRTIEIAVGCTESLHSGKLRRECTLFYNRLLELHQGRIGDVGMHSHLRPMPQTHGVKVGLELEFAFWNPWKPPSVFRDKRWSYEVGEWLEKMEFEWGWKEGEKY